MPPRITSNQLNLLNIDANNVNTIMNAELNKLHPMVMRGLPKHEIDRQEIVIEEHLRELLRVKRRHAEMCRIFNSYPPDERA